MKIAMASDHAGFSLKEEIARVLRDRGHEIEDFGAYSEDAVDLSDHVYPAALAVGEGRAERGPSSMAWLWQRSDREQNLWRLCCGLSGPVLRRVGEVALGHKCPVHRRQDHWFSDRP